MSTSDLQQVEHEIDQAFANNGLVDLNYAQCVWTLLSVVEDHHYKMTVVKPLDRDSAAIYVDRLINALTYPMRVCHRKPNKEPKHFKREFVDDHYDLANKWLDAAYDYRHFCSMFPLYHNQQINLRVDGTRLITTDWSSTDLSYEVYDRFIKSRNPEKEVRLNPNEIAGEIAANTTIRKHSFSLNFSPKLAARLIAHCSSAFTPLYTLPDGWMFRHFTIGQFKTVFGAIQSLAYGWSVARQISAQKGVPAIAYASALWTPETHALRKMLTRYTAVPEPVVEKILEYLTFGELQIRNPDIAIQPLVDLSNGQYAISPFVLLNVNSERNFCVLLNQIPEERSLYSRLVEEKEERIRAAIISTLADLGLDFRNGGIDGTNIDLAIIDHAHKKCLCIEIKWFIEPAEIREVLARSEELAKGVDQAKKIAKTFLGKNPRLLKLLGITEEYDFLTMVGSVNFIGGSRTQHPDVPITKLWHLESEIGKNRDLGIAMEWLRKRLYLPQLDRDYKITIFPIKSGKWESNWYGIAYA